MFCLLKWFSENLRKKLCKCIPLLNYFTCPTATAGLIIGKYILIKWRFTRMLWNFKIVLFWVSPTIKTNCSVFVEILSGEHVAVLFSLLCEVAFDAKLGKWFSWYYFKPLFVPELKFSVSVRNFHVIQRRYDMAANSFTKLSFKLEKL